MTHAPLFAGINGFGLAADRMGFTQPFHCEIDNFCQIIIQHLWPQSKPYYDIRQTDFTIWRGKIDVLTGGFPCQPYSTAGKRLGKEDARHLWPEMLRAIREIRPRFIVGENVPGILSWNGGLVFEEVCADLEAEGYEVQPNVLPAASVEAPHRRDRVWFVAYANSNGYEYREFVEYRREEGESQSIENKRERVWNNNTGNDAERPFTNSSSINGWSLCRHEALIRGENQKQCFNCDISSRGIFTNPTSPGSEAWEQNGEWENTKENRSGVDNRPQRPCNKWNATNPTRENGVHGFENATNPDIKLSQGRICKNRSIETERYTSSSLCGNAWGNFPTQSPICDGNDGFPYESLRQRIREDSLGHLSEKEIDEILSKAFKRWRKESIMAGGNAIVEQVAYQIFKALSYE